MTALLIQNSITNGVLTMKLRIEILTGYASPWSKEIEGAYVTIGRASEANVRLHPTKDTACSRGIHARIVNRDGTWYLRAEHDSGVTVLDSRDRVLQKLGNGDEYEFDQEVVFELGDGGPRLAANALGAELPVTDRRRHGGAAKQPVGRVSGDVITKARQAPKLIAAVTALVIIVGGVGWYLNSQTARTVEQTQAELEQVENVVGEVELRVDESEMAIALADQRIEAGEERIATAEERAIENETRLARLEEASDELVVALRDALKSVYLVKITTVNGKTLYATAWAVGPRLLATNAHVAIKLQETGASGVARSTGSPPTDVEIVGTRIHPGYDRWGSGKNRAVRSVDHGFKVVRYIPMCDVALLETAEDIGPELQLASQEELYELHQGDEIGYVGFPIDNIVGPVVNRAPILDVGRITHLIDMFVEIAAPKFQHVLGYGLNTAGGASGSPIIARNGKVIGVHNAGSYLNLQLQHKRVPVGFPFGQRVDLLRELVDGTAEANQVQRDRQWADRLAALAISPEASSSYYLQLHRRGRFSKHSPISIDSWWLTPADGDQLNVAQGYPLEPGTYLITAASTAWTNIDITVETAAPNWFTFELLGEEPSRVRKVTMLPNWRDSFLLFEVTEPIEVDLTLLVKSAFVQDEETLVKLYQLIPPPTPTPSPAP